MGEEDEMVGWMPPAESVPLIGELRGPQDGQGGAGREVAPIPGAGARGSPQVWGLQPDLPGSTERSCRAFWGAASF